MFQWWQTGRTGRDLRLTLTGLQAFEYAKIEKYTFDVDPKSFHKQFQDLGLYIMHVGKKLQCPFYLGTRKLIPYITVYDDQIAVMLGLYGSLDEYLASL